MMGQKRGSASHFSHWNFLAVMKQIQSESKVILFLFSSPNTPSLPAFVAKVATSAE